MPENKTPTAQEYIKKFYEENIFSNLKNRSEYLMIEFAKMHVKAALEAAFENAKVITHYDVGGYASNDVVDTSILNSYPLENIK